MSTAARDLARREHDRSHRRRTGAPARPRHRGSLFVTRAADLWSRRARRAARMQQGVREGLHGAARDSDRPLSGVRAARPRPGAVVASASSVFRSWSRLTVSRPARVSSSRPTARLADAAIAAAMEERQFGDAGSRRAGGMPRGARGLGLRARATADARLPLGSAQDHKRVFDDDRGTEHRRDGGIRSESAGRCGDGRRESCSEIVEPVIRGMRARVTSTGAFSMPG